MKRALARALALGALFAGIAPAFAKAPADQYDHFNYEQNYIHDARTGIYWQRFSPKLTTVSGADTACDGVTFGPSEQYQGRLPSVKELLTIVDEDGADQQIGQVVVHVAIDIYAFPDAPSASFCATSGWLVQFATGASRRGDPGDVCYVRCAGR